MRAIWTRYYFKNPYVLDNLSVWLYTRIISIWNDYSHCTFRNMGSLLRGTSYCI